MPVLEEYIADFQKNIILQKFVKITIILVITFLAIFIANLFFEKTIKKSIEKYNYSNKINTVSSVTKNFINVVIYFLSITAILNVFNINTSSILAVAGIGGMAIAFAAQSIIKDVISGAFILIENQFNVGDYITINSIGGTVEYIGLRLTKLRDIDGKEIIIPNGEISLVINHSINQSRAAVEVIISDNTKYETIETLLNQACKQVFEKSENFITIPEVLGIQEFNNFGYKILIQTYTQNGLHFVAQRELRREILNVLGENGINISNLKEKKWNADKEI